MDRDRVIADLKQDEGFVPHAYQDHLGFTSVGYGFMVDQRKNGRIPREVADFWLNHEISRLDELLRERINCYADAPEGVKRALVNMAYQMGLNGLLRFQDMLQSLEYECYGMAADCALDSLWARQTPERAKRVAEWIRTA